MSLRGRLLGMLSYRTVVTTCRLHHTITYMNVSAGVYAQRMESQREFDRLMEDCRQNEDRQNGNCKKKELSQQQLFMIKRRFTSQYFPQCVKYLFKELSMYWAVCVECVDCYRINECVVMKEGFVCYECDFVRFHVDAVESSSTPDELEVFAQCVGEPLLALVLKDRWFKGDFERLRAMLVMEDRGKLVAFVKNCLWERSYEDNYTLGQQLSIRMTTNLIQSGLDFKHHVNNDRLARSRGWNCEEFEKLVCTIKSVADITKRYKWPNTYVMLEVDRNNAAHTMSLLHQNFSTVITNNYSDNVCLVRVKGKSMVVLRRIRSLLHHKLVNVVFVTDTENYLHTHRLFYVYNSMKFYYYCLKNKFVFLYDDYETLYFVHTIVLLEIINGGSLNSFTLEKSPIMHPLELNSRRCNALKRAAAYNKTLCNDMELKVDFIKGKRITTGTHDPNRLVEITAATTNNVL
uniref:ORF68 n=1 Tax=Cydia pomonella granulosis virus TaxID=28289 RepID=A0A097P2A6_GVCP|nr:ORF68 [Cydia pomonella granulovirus]QDW81127.1 p47 [Cydia pomonella granulovirus]QGY99419.1 p47 [Cydia pomonella granulovirus]QGY99986.1 p47 [Cydia pomonella granulovirus]